MTDMSANNSFLFTCSYTIHELIILACQSIDHPIQFISGSRSYPGNNHDQGLNNDLHPADNISFFGNTNKNDEFGGSEFESSVKRGFVSRSKHMSLKHK